MNIYIFIYIHIHIHIYRSIEWGYKKLNLHCETKETPALSLYLKNKFEIVRTVDEKKEILWMTKTL
jgi:hypothetical protein